MLEQEINDRASVKGQQLISYKMVLISNKKPQAVQLFEAISQTNFDICYTKQLDETLISVVKPQVIVYDFDSSVPNTIGVPLTTYLDVKLKVFQQFNTPVILLLTESDYLTLAPIDIDNITPLIWPATHDVLISNMEKLVKEQSRLVIYEDSIVFKDLIIDTKRMIVKQNGVRVDLTKTEYDLLVFFIDSEGVVQTREVLLEKIWKLQLFEGSNIVDVHIKSLRKKLNDSAVDPKYVMTVRGVGYRLADI